MLRPAFNPGAQGRELRLVLCTNLLNERISGVTWGPLGACDGDGEGKGVGRVAVSDLAAYKACSRPAHVQYVV